MALLLQLSYLSTHARTIELTYRSPDASSKARIPRRRHRHRHRHPRDDPREDVGVRVGVGVVECHLKGAVSDTRQ